MRADIHPDVREVVFEDTINQSRFKILSAVKTKDTVTIDGEEFPLVKVDISSTSTHSTPVINASSIPPVVWRNSAPNSVAASSPICSRKKEKIAASCGYAGCARGLAEPAVPIKTSAGSLLW